MGRRHPNQLRLVLYPGHDFSCALLPLRYVVLDWPATFDGEPVPQRLKPGIAVLFTARLKPCPSGDLVPTETLWPRIF
jgi:hypothetical protein